jgi:hypothetical protein
LNGIKLSKIKWIYVGKTEVCKTESGEKNKPLQNAAPQGIRELVCGEYHIYQNDRILPGNYLYQFLG